MSQTLTEMFTAAGLPTDFASKAEVLFEAAVTEKVAALVTEQTAQLQESFDKRLTEAKEEFIKEQSENFDGIVQEAIVEWVEKNSAALDSSIKAEVLGELTKHLKEAFTVAEVLTPEGQAGLLESKAQAVTDAEARAEGLAAELSEATAKLDAYARADIVAELTEGLSELATDRIARLAVGLCEQSLEQFETSVQVLVEAFGGKVNDPKPKDGDNSKAEKIGKVNEGGDNDPGVDAVPPTDDDDKSEKGNAVTESTDLVSATLAFMNRGRKA